MASLVKTDKISTTAGGAQEFTLPAADGTANQHLKTDGSGVLGWASPPSANPLTLTGSTNTWIPTITGADALTGTANLTYDGNVLDIKNAGTASSIKLYCESSNAHYTEIKSGPHSGATQYTLTLPNKPPTVNGQVLSATTAGVSSWADPGALVHLHTTTVSSVVSEIQVNDVFSAAYTNYKIILTNIVPDTDNNTIYMGFKENSGATQLNMNSLTRYFGVNNAGATIYGDSSEYNMGGQELFKTASNTVGINGIIEVYVPFASGTNNMTRTTYTLTGWNAAASGEVHTYGMSQAGATTSTPCFRLFSSNDIGDATITGYIRVYGYKDS